MEVVSEDHDPLLFLAFYGLVVVSTKPPKVSHFWQWNRKRTALEYNSFFRGHQKLRLLSLPAWGTSKAAPGGQAASARIGARERDDWPGEPQP